MDFFYSLSQVAKNNKNFNRWEQEQRDNQAQREELYNRRTYSDEEIEAAKQLGERIIDVVDIMDNHSENVAENVETATAPIVSFAPLLGALIPGVYVFKKILPNTEDSLFEIEKQMFLQNKEASELADKITESIHKTRPNKASFNPWHFSSKKEISKIPDADLRAKAMEIYNEYSKKAKPYKRKFKGGLIGIVASSVLAFIGANIYSAKLQVDSSKIARYQARKILEDPKAFVNYTPEQIAAAKKYIEEHPELKKQKKKEKLKSGMFKSIINILKDRKAYKNAKKNDTDDSKKVARALTPEEIIEAKKDKEVIQRSVRLINNEAEKYSENMEVAAGIILGSTPVLGGLIGWLTGVVMNKTGLTEHIVSKIVDKNGSEEAKAAYYRFKELKAGAPGYSTRWSKFANKLMSDYPEKMTEEANAGRMQTPKKEILKVFKKALAAGMSHKWLNSKIIGLAGAILSSIPAALIALKLQKSSARAGRYTAKRELEKDPRNFIGYTEEDFEEVKDVKGEKETFGQKFKEYVLFVPTVLKQYYAYDKYKRTEFKEHQLLLDELKKADVSEQQLQDAKNLQRKLFNTFEKVDDNSQIYSESMEAATEILQPFALSAGILVMISPVLCAGYQMARGKITAASATEWLTKKLANASNFLKGKTFKKYLNDVAEKIPHKVGNVEVQNKPIAALLAEMDFNNDTIGTLGAKFVKNINNISYQFRRMNNFEQVVLLKNIEKNIDNLAAISDIQYTEYKPAFEKFKYVITELQKDSFDPKLRADMLDILIKNTDAVRRMPEDRFKAAISKYVDITYDVIGDDKIYRFIQQTVEIPEERRSPMVNELLKQISSSYQLDGNGNLSFFNKKAFKKGIVEYFEKENITTLYSDVDEFFKKLSGYFPYTLKEVPDGIDNIIEFLNKKGESIFGQAERLQLPGAAAEAVEEKAQRPIRAMLKKLSEPKEYLKKLKDDINNMTDTEFQNLADLRGFSSMDKKTMLSVLSNLEKMYDNIPKAELGKIGKILLKEFREHPDEFMQALKTGQLPAALLTNSVVTTAAVAGVSWTVLNIALMWAIQTWLADIQLKSGRLGVMKALESLEDPAYYADVIPSNKQETKEQSVTSAQMSSVPTAQTRTGNLLDRFKSKEQAK